MTFRPLKHTLLFSLLGLSLFTGCGGQGPPKKNVVLIVVDTLRADRMSLHGGERRTTPAIDAWAKDGVVFENASAASSWTNPSMNMLLTGRYRYGPGKLLCSSQRPLSEVLQAVGYSTHGVVANAILVGDQGFDVGYESYDLTPATYETDEVPLRSGWPGSVVVDKGISWIKRLRGEEPFMLYLHLMDPHYPYKPIGGVPESWDQNGSPEKRSVYEAALAPQHSGAIDDSLYLNMEQKLAAYDAEILETDEELFRLFAFLNESGLSEDTIVVLTSDHGEALWSHSSVDGWGLVSEKGREQSIVPELYRPHGEQLYEELIHVPLCIVGPGVPRGARDQRAVSLIDVVPTLLSLLDISSPTELHGYPLIGGEELDPQRELYSNIARGTSVTVNGRWKLHLPSDRLVESGGRAILFDLKNDPAEREPLDDPVRIDALTKKILSWRERNRERGEDFSLEEHRNRLLQMGYFGLASELDEDITEERKRELLQLDRLRKQKRRPGYRPTEKDSGSDEGAPKDPK